MIRNRNSGIRTVNTSSLVDISSLSELRGITDFLIRSFRI